MSLRNVGIGAAIVVGSAAIVVGGSALADAAARTAGAPGAAGYGAPYVVEGRQDDDPRRLRRDEESLGGGQTVEQRHADVLSTTGPRGRRQLECGQPVPRLADDLDLGLRLEDHPEAGAQQLLVVGHQDADPRSHAVIVVAPLCSACPPQG